MSIGSSATDILPRADGWIARIFTGQATPRVAFNYVAETVQGATSGASKEANKEVAKDGNAPLGTRASAAKDALGDKIDQSTHENKAEVHKQIAKE
ncbi:hypothetical protein FDECE_7714 [Fusarium decemcellulare]|nr:hypothetical protein FDECE_7714 [Fusarium decemcellulare]